MSRAPQGKYLENRVVFCANCEANRPLSISSFGPVCSVCSSDSWVHLQTTWSQKLADATRSVARAAQAGTTKVVELMSSSRLAPLVDKAREVGRASSARLAPVRDLLQAMSGTRLRPVKDKEPDPHKPQVGE